MARTYSQARRFDTTPGRCEPWAREGGWPRASENDDAVRVVGLTGGIGSGKSTVAAILRELGAVVIDADVLAREAVAPGSPGLAAVVARFGPEVLTPDGALDRRALGRHVFKDDAARADLNAIVHPRVGALFAARVAAARAAGAPLVVYDVPLLFESGLQAGFEAVIVAYVDPETQRARVAARDHLPPDEIEDRIRAQRPLAEKAAAAQHVIDNTGTLEATRAQVQALFARLSREDT
jgi:dephospho-CoA kinase